MQESKVLNVLKAGQQRIMLKLASLPMIDKATHAQNKRRVHLVDRLGAVNDAVRSQENLESFSAVA